MKTIIIVACDKNGIIGKNGTLPWRLPGDLKLFKKRTTGHAVIMGRKTWESIPKKPLPERANVVLSRKNYMLPENLDGPYIYHSLEQAITLIRSWNSDALGKYATKDVFIIGGAELYNYAIGKKLVDQIIMSKIPHEYDGDVSFPSINSEWAVINIDKHDGFDVVTFEKKERQCPMT